MWVMLFENCYELRPFSWDSFHRQRMALAKRLKAEIGDRAMVLYVKPHEDPSHNVDSKTELV